MYRDKEPTYKVWTDASKFCYRRGCNCRGCYMREIIELILKNKEPATRDEYIKARFDEFVNHNNLGDHAISLAENNLLRDLGIRCAEYPWTKGIESFLRDSHRVTSWY